MNYKTYYLKAAEIADRIAEGDRSVTERPKQGIEEAQQGLIARRKQVDTPKQGDEGGFGGFLAEVFSTLSSPKKEGKDVKVKKATPHSPRPRKFTDNVQTREYGKRLMADLQEILGITKEQAAGIVGNLDHETGGFKFLQEIEPLVKGSRGGWGFAQWTGPRRKAFEAWAEENNMDISSYEGNLGFLIHELQNTSEGRVMDRLMQAETPDQAAEIFSAGFLRPGIPHMDSRIARANKYYSEVL